MNMKGVEEDASKLQVYLIKETAYNVAEERRKEECLSDNEEE